MQDIIKEYGQTVIASLVSIMLMAIIFGGVYLGVTGVSAGIGKASTKSNSQIGAFVSDYLANDSDVIITVKEAPKIDTSYLLTNTDNTGDTLTLFDISEEIDSFQVIRIYNNNGISIPKEDYTCTATEITFNERGYYNLLIEAKKDNKCYRKIFKFIIVDENGDWQ